MLPSRLSRILADVEDAPAPGHHVVVWVVSVALLLSVIGGILAWRSYHDRVAREGEQIAEAATEAAAITEQFFVDRIAMLAAVVGVPSIRSSDPATMGPALEALSRPGLGFDGGVGWVDLDGMLRAEAGVTPGALPVDVSDRRYVHEVLARQAPYVSEVIRGRLSGDELVVLAAPTFGDSGDMTGLLVASMRISDMSRLIPVLSSASMEVRLVDRAGNVVIDGGAVGSLQPPANPAVLNSSGAVTGTGLEGDPGRVVAVAPIPTPDWVVIMEQAESVLLAGARSRFVGELGVLAALALITIAVAMATARRLDQSHRRVMQGAEDLAALDALRGAMAPATTIDGVAAAALPVFGEVLGTNAVAIGIAGPSRERLRVWGGLSAAKEADTAGADAALMEAMKADRTLLIDAAGLRERVLLPDVPDSTGLLAAPFSGRKTAGAVAVATEGGQPPPRVRIFETMVASLGEALERASAVEAERGASHTFQRALLPRDTIGAQVPLQRAVRYQSASDVEVGGDWYDLWLIDDERVGVVVGDVVGRGVEAAAAMGQLRSALRAIAASAATPQDALDRLDSFAREISGTPSATVFFGILDVGRGELTMASAGHLPPLVAGPDGTRVLAEVRGIPIGFVTERRIGEGHSLALTGGDTVVIYTDGLVERRGEVIDEGIGRLERALAANAHRPVEALATALLDECAADQDDDVALVCFRHVMGPPRHFTCSSPLHGMEVVWDALGAWLAAKGTPAAGVAETLAAVRGAVAAVTEVCGDTTSCEVLVEVDADGVGEVEIEHRDVSLAADSAGADAELLRRWAAGTRTATGVRVAVPIVGWPAPAGAATLPPPASPDP